MFIDQGSEYHVPPIRTLSLREYEGTAVTEGNLLDRFLGTYDLDVDSVEQCAR